MAGERFDQVRGIQPRDLRSELRALVGAALSERGGPHRGHRAHLFVLRGEVVDAARVFELGIVAMRAGPRRCAETFAERVPDAAPVIMRLTEPTARSERLDKALI